MNEFFHMGGYAAVVWGAYGVTFTGLIVMAALSIARHRRLRRQAEALRAQLAQEQTL